jgi:hypothetical protein
MTISYTMPPELPQIKVPSFTNQKTKTQSKTMRKTKQKILRNPSPPTASPWKFFLGHLVLPGYQTDGVVDPTYRLSTTTDLGNRPQHHSPHRSITAATNAAITAYRTDHLGSTEAKTVPSDRFGSTQT